MKKIVALTLCLASVIALLCACKPKENLNASSTMAGTESSAIASQETESETNSSKTSSVVDAGSSKKENEESSDNKSSSTNSIDGTETPSDVASVSTSSSVKINFTDPSLEIGAYHFNPLYTNNYADEEHFLEYGDNLNPIPMETKLEELEDVLKAGYFNTIILEKEHFDNEALWQILEKYEIKVWFCIWSLFNSSKKTLEEYMKSYDTLLAKIQANPKRWKMFNGFTYDESVHRGQSVEDFNAVCKYFYQKYGKRNFPVFAPNEISKLWDDPSLGEMNTFGFQYVTDAAFDVYTVDVRPNEYNGGSNVTYAQAYYPDIVDGKSFFTVITNEMLKMADHPVNVWFYPNAQIRTAPAGLADEAYCVAQLDFFVELLTEEYEHPGGIILYTYAQWNKDQKGLQSMLVLEDDKGNSKIRPNDKKWKSYSNMLKRITGEFRNTPVKPILDPTKA